MRGLLALPAAIVLVAFGSSACETPMDSARTTQVSYATGRIAPSLEQFVRMPREGQLPSQPAAPKGDEPKYSTGRVPPTKAMFEQIKQNPMPRALEAFPDAKDPKWDSREHGWIGPIKNQGQCGSCWDFSGTGIIEAAFVKAGRGKASDFILSEQYTLSCYGNGGCNGDDNTVVLKHAKKIGLPTTKEYGPYRANEGRCNNSPMKFYKIDDWGLADGNVGYEAVGNTQKIKNAIKACGAVGVAICADNALMNVRPGEVFRGKGRMINHEVILVGWDDTKIPGKTCWLLRNSWGTGWGDGGYCWIEEGANRVGVQPVYAYVAGSVPDPEPQPDTAEVHRVIRIGVVVLLVAIIVVAVFVVIRKIKGTPTKQD